MFPTKKHQIKTSLSKSQITERLQDIVGTSYDDKEFCGTVEDDGFKIYKKPAPNVRNSSNPIIQGEIKESADSTEINLNFRMHLFPIIFYTIWLSGIILGLLIGILLLFAKDIENGLILTFACLGMILFEQLLTRIPFHFCTKKSISILERILK